MQSEPSPSKTLQNVEKQPFNPKSVTFFKSAEVSPNLYVKSALKRCFLPCTRKKSPVNF